MKKDNMPQVARFWNDIAEEFDTIYTGRKGQFARFLDQWLRKDIYQRFEWVMERSGDVRGKSICDIGCGSGRFVTEFVKRGAEHRRFEFDACLKMLRSLPAHVRKEQVTAR